MSATYRRLSVSMATAGRQRFPVNCRRVVVLQHSGPFSIRLEAEGNDEIPINRPGKVVDCRSPVADLFIDLTAAQVVAGGSIELLLSDELVIDFESLTSAAQPARLIGTWQGANGAGPLSLLDNENTGKLNNLGAGQHYGYKAAINSWCTELQLPANAVAAQWAHLFAPESPLDVMHFVDPLFTAALAAQLAMACAYRLDIPINISAFVNNGVVGGGQETRVHVGFLHSENGMAGGTFWPGPGLFFVTNDATGTWWAVIAGYNAGAAAPNDRIQYFAADTGITFMAPRVLTICVGLQASGAPVVQWAIDGVIRVERLTRYAVGGFSAPTNFGSGAGASFQQYQSAGVASYKQLGDALETVYLQTLWGTGWRLWQREGLMIPGVLLPV
jgi:hypothetical protein